MHLIYNWMDSFRRPAMSEVSNRDLEHPGQIRNQMSGNETRPVLCATPHPDRSQGLLRSLDN